jgi:predicted GIY-YIG superfamily endonuclease
VSKLVDLVPTDAEVEDYAQAAYERFCSYRVIATNVAHPLWKHLRQDMKSFWRGQARVTLSFYAYHENPVVGS